MELFTALGVDSTVWIKFTMTLLIFIGLSQVAFGPFMQALEEREGRTTGGVEKAGKILQETESLRANYESLARELNAEIKTIFKEQQVMASRDADELLAAVRSSEQQKVAQFKQSLAQQIQSEKAKIDQWVSSVSNEIVKKAME